MQPVTLSDLIADHKLLWCYCTVCDHERATWMPLSPPLPGETPVPQGLIEPFEEATGRCFRASPYGNGQSLKRNRLDFYRPLTF
jgi:hypothetical protein